MVTLGDKERGRAADARCTQYTRARAVLYMCMCMYMYMHMNMYVFMYAYMCEGVYVCIHLFAQVGRAVLGAGGGCDAARAGRGARLGAVQASSHTSHTW